MAIVAWQYKHGFCMVAHSKSDPCDEWSNMNERVKREVRLTAGVGWATKHALSAKHECCFNFPVGFDWFDY